MEKRGKAMAKLRAVLLLLIEQHPLAAEYCEHPSRGEWYGFRDLHIEPDWLLIYRIEDGELQVARTGTHSDLFRE